MAEFDTTVLNLVRGNEDMSMRAAALLFAVADAPGLSVGKYAETLNVSKPAITRATDFLLDSGLVARRVDADDKRLVKISLTKIGEKHAQRIRAGFAPAAKKRPTSAAKLDAAA